MTVQFDGFTIGWLGYATARIEDPDGTVVYTDPGRYGVLDGYTARDGDVVLVTHAHHYEADGIDRVAGSDATVVIHEAVDTRSIERDVRPISELPHTVIRVREGDTLDVGATAVHIDVTPAYNISRADGGPVSHPEGMGCGYRFTLGGRSIFWPGDTDVLPAFDTLDVSIFLANIGGSVVMDRHDAADLADEIRPDLVVPIHYDTIDMLEADAQAFVVDVARRSIPVALDPPH